MNVSKPTIVDLDRDAIKRGLSEDSILLVDVREPHEFAEGHIPGAVSHPLSAFDPTSIPTDRRVVLSCRSGVRSVRAAELAQAAGIDLREHYKGGFKDWSEAGEPVE
ncbi:rhodanese-like domain-containing protein [Microvirga brassicacearum]|uniref:Rhodanese-like domain-containing protein n=1 Tax=Microvirga brassicacearum TaxID=2580413 RepID=A0A5N3PB32_9HYPH|nr:rhodanese-like domain-containing protein [Microvirga brassicacearum]KAB0266949.1 rhodanese-like domain-containing protein [Microvirga brassicacearum]